ncbi:hypothetical protein DFH08DRAFT_953116 [Mycena albidolilacea]|uniref:CxC2-like cysteine cluster KDZ transposase-associated domain-containing protein n=1 Tax=Mycena albidolilacea TaxID=1033008 RepID=A0AAD7EZ09_9AGAR|nr:hypothetical protein DFH08DRAFT_953116 [Mycena albidolilacea]
MVGAHKGTPFHSVREWSERVGCYIPATLRDMGLRVGFGHGGGTCSRPCGDRLEAITVIGIKTVNVDFCTCRGAYDDEGQIKLHGWWPLGSNFVSAMNVRTLDLLLGDEPELPTPSGL